MPRTFALRSALLLLFHLGYCVAQTTSLPDASKPSDTLGHEEAIASYDIEVTLNPVTHVVSGRETLHFRNPSDVEATEIYLHAYLNAFRDTKTRFMRDSLAARSAAITLGSPGQLRLTSVLAREFGNVDLYVTRDPHSPGDPDDDTDIRLPLPHALPAHGTLTLDITFEAQLPSLLERAGHADGFYAVTQWFPKIARRTKDGTFRHFSYSPLAEFSADFGDYHVTLEVPSNLVVAAPGKQTQNLALPEKGQKRLVYALEHAHDFAWFAWDKFVATKTRIGDVDVTYYAGPGQSGNTLLSLSALRFALPFLSRSFFEYPYDTLTVVHPPDIARAASAMEYPGLIVTGGPWFLAAPPLRYMQSLTFHELLHQWFYGAVANDEYLHPVLDEGITSYLESVLLREAYGDASAIASPWLTLSEAPIRRFDGRDRGDVPRLGQAAPEFGTFSRLSSMVYSRFATVLETLGNVYGKARLLSALGSYARKYRFAHPEPEDLVAVITEELGNDAGKALSTALSASGTVDFAVVELLSRPSRNPSGRVESRVVVERHGTLNFPVVLEATLASGEKVRRTITVDAQRTTVNLETTAPVVCATVDPDEQITLDRHRENQTKRIDPKPFPKRLFSLAYALLSFLFAGFLP